ncbi:late histone H2B.L4-like [Melitaea cinxia]|uniref:late histone H2B.L4-like n=1 Tax=Melitaea cinxia TaxID=113334 RepID=UPI001E271A68|nr:late histone H2B.L4-like [Melitaea cinxia]
MVPKSTLHSNKKKKDVIEKPIAKTKKMKKKNYQSFSIYIFKLLRSVTKESFGISRHSMLIMNNFVNDMLEKIASEAGKLASHSKKTTLGSREMQSAIRLVLPGELAKHANIEAMKAITMYHNSHEREGKTP